MGMRGVGFLLRARDVRPLRAYDHGGIGQRPWGRDLLRPKAWHRFGSGEVPYGMLPLPRVTVPHLLRHRCHEKIMKMLLRLLTEEDGPTAVEYAVMLALIIMVCISAVMLVGQSTSNSFSNSSNQLQTVISS
jgi:pilus assembly protein Flp/PilA